MTLIRNFVGARMLIQAFKLPSNRDEGEAERKFLENFIKAIDTLEGEVKKSLSVKKSMNQAIDRSILKKAIQQSHQHCHDRAHELLIELQKEIKRTSQAKQQSSDYLKLMNKLMECCLGIINNASSLCLAANKKSFNEDGFRGIILYDFCIDLGGYCLPSHQYLDPLIGCVQGAGNREKYEADDGHCLGYVYSWAKQIEINGEAAFLNVLDPVAHYYQTHYHETHYSPTNKITGDQYCLYPVKSSITKILAQINQEHIYYIALGNLEIGHATGIRRRSHGAIEFFDPNFGLFIFPDENTFIEFFVFFTSVCNLGNKAYNIISYSPIAAQKQAVKIDDIVFKKKEKSDFPMRNYLTRKSYQQLFKDWDNAYKENFYSYISLGQLKENFINNITVRIERTSDIKVLTYLYELFSMDDNTLAKEENKDYAFINILKKRRYAIIDELSFWKENKNTATINKLKAMIDARIDQVINAQVRSRASAY